MKQHVNVLVAGVFVVIGPNAIHGEAPEVPLISSRQIADHSLVYTLNQDFVEPHLRNSTFYVHFDKSIPLTELPETFLDSALITQVYGAILLSGKTYTIEALDEGLYNSMQKIRPILQALYPNTSLTGNLIPQEVISHSQVNTRLTQQFDAALFFTGGVDSTCAALKLQENNKKLLLILLRDEGLKDEYWTHLKASTQKFADRYNHTLVCIESNYYRFLNLNYLNTISKETADHRVDLIEDFGMFGIGWLAAVSMGVHEVHMASSRDWRYPYISIGNPLIDSLISFVPHVTIHCDQFDYTRVDKVKYILENVQSGAIEPPLLHVCSKRLFPSCTLLDCRKCLPTAFMIYALGGDPQAFGYSCAGNELIEYMKAYLQQKQPHITLWQLMRLRETLTEINPTASHLYPWLYQNLRTSLNSDYTSGKLSLTWDEFRAFDQHGVIPKGIKKRELS